MNKFSGTIAFEEKMTVDGRRLDKYALRWKLPVSVPVLRYGDVDLIGRIYSIRRFDRIIQAEGWIDEDFVGSWGCGIDINQARMNLEDEGSLLTISDGLIVSLVTGPDYRPAWDDCKISIVQEELDE